MSRILSAFSPLLDDIISCTRRASAVAAQLLKIFIARISHRPQARVSHCLVSGASFQSALIIYWCCTAVVRVLTFTEFKANDGNGCADERFAIKEIKLNGKKKNWRKKDKRSYCIRAGALTQKYVVTFHCASSFERVPAWRPTIIEPSPRWLSSKSLNQIS